MAVDVFNEDGENDMEFGYVISVCIHSFAF